MPKAELISLKEVKKISEKYLYRTREDDWESKMNSHIMEMHKNGYKLTSVKTSSNGYVITYIKYADLDLSV